MENKKQFQDSMDRLGNYFGIKITPEILRAYYDQLYYIPQNVLSDICSKLIAESKPFKTNFPVIASFGPLYESHKPNQDTIREFKEQPCDECNGEGLIYFKFWHFKHGMVYSSHVACSQCGNWKKHYSTLDAHSVYDGEGQFLYRHRGIGQNTKEGLSMKNEVLEIPNDGVFRMSKKQLSERVMELLGETH